MNLTGATDVHNGSSKAGLVAPCFFVFTIYLSLLFSCGIDERSNVSTGSQAATQSSQTADSERSAGTALVASAAPDSPANIDQLGGRAILVEGSRIVKGLPGFGRNALSALYGEYSILGEKGTPVRVPVWYTRENLVIPSSWKKTVCRSMTAGFNVLSASEEPDGSSLWILSTTEYHLMVQIPEDIGDSCGFITKFSDRFSFFYRYASVPEDISFPAILELGN